MQRYNKNSYLCLNIFKQIIAMNRKSIITTLFLSLFFVFTMQAQLHLGMKFGLNSANARLSGEYASSMDVNDFIGVQVGPILEFIPGGKGLGLDVALLYSNEGFKLAGTTIANVRTEATTYKSNQILIPANLKYKLSVLPKVASFFATAGPYARFQFEDIKEQYKTKTFGIGLNLGLGVEVIQRVQVGFNWQWGLTDDYNNMRLDSNLPAELKGKTSNKTISLTYFFF